REQAGGRSGEGNSRVWLASGGQWSTVARSGGHGCCRARMSPRVERRRWVVFLGTHAPRLDEKGRLFLPAKFRDELAEGLVITKGQERCLYVFPTAEFGRLTDALRTAPVTAKRSEEH